MVLGGDLCNEVLARGVPVLAWVWCGRISIRTHREPAEGGALVAQDASDGASIHVCDPGYVVAEAPAVEGLDSGMMRELFAEVGNDDGGGLYAERLNHDPNLCGGDLCSVARYTIVADHRGGEYEDLASIRRVGHRLRVGSDGSGKHSFTKDTLWGTE